MTSLLPSLIKRNSAAQYGRILLTFIFPPLLKHVPNFGGFRSDPEGVKRPCQKRRGLRKGNPTRNATGVLSANVHPRVNMMMIKHLKRAVEDSQALSGQFQVEQRGKLPQHHTRPQHHQAGSYSTIAKIPFGRSGYTGNFPRDTCGQDRLMRDCRLKTKH